ncbi:unnamed protein product [Adineta ricciae]|uniref:Uncharacterized protein n=1 Tax=Adineta ricciae TaxID=249248 RepID=A0A816CKT1_ADIRI|nr:unnamed protein product [Adineta ricciae]
MSSASANIQTKIQAANVLRHELEALKTGRVSIISIDNCIIIFLLNYFQKVYVQQPGSLVFFKSDKDTTLKNCHENLKSLQREYEQIGSKMDQS